MKEVRAIIRPNRRERLREALRTIPNFPGVSMFSAQGFTAPAAVDKRTVRDELTDFSEKTMVCVLCPDDMVETIRNVIITSCSTGQIGDGLVWVLDVASVHRVRNAEPMA